MNDLSHQSLRFEGWVRRDRSSLGARRRGLDHVGKGFGFRHSAQPTGVPFPKVILDPLLTRLPEEAPGFPARSRHHGHPGKFGVGIFRSVATAESLNQAYNFAALF